MSENIELQQRMTVLFRRFARSMEATGDAARIAADSWIRHDRREWEFPHLVLSDEDRDVLEARQLRRIIESIDDLPETGH